MRDRCGATLWLLVFVALGRHAAPLGAQVARTAGVVLELPASARALALGDAFVAVGGDDASIFYNPAQVAAAPSMALGLSMQRHIAQSRLGALSLVGRAGPGSFALGLLVLDYGSVEEIIPDPASGGERGIPTGATVAAGEYAMSLGYAVSARGLRLGAAGKLVRQRIAEVSGGAGALDLGVAVDVWNGATLAASVQNLGGRIAVGAGANGDPLPRLVRVGAAVPLRGVGPLDVLTSVELSRSRDGRAEPSGGAEVTWAATEAVAFIGRVGVLGRAARSAASPVLVGGGIAARRLALDYAYQGFDVLGASHRIGVRWWR
jgi:hypothetical protein